MGCHISDFQHIAQKNRHMFFLNSYVNSRLKRLHIILYTLCYSLHFSSMQKLIVKKNENFSPRS